MAPRPTYLRGDELINVAGESYHQDALRAIVGDAAWPDGVRLEREAVLVPEPDNPHDPNAVTVLVERRKVGYLPRAAAVAYAQLVADVTARGREPRCEAIVAGRPGDEGVSSLGVFLRLPAPEERRGRRLGGGA